MSQYFVIGSEPLGRAGHEMVWPRLVDYRRCQVLRKLEAQQEPYEIPVEKRIDLENFPGKNAKYRYHCYTRLSLGGEWLQREFHERDL